MKKTIIIILFFIINLSIFAQPDTLQNTFKSANDAYLKENYEKAIENYEKIVSQNYESVELYYNLGNAYFKQNNIAKAVLNYNRALVLSPNNEDVLANLDFVNRSIKDEFTPVPEFILDRIFKGIVKIFSSNTWALISINTFLLALVIFLIFLFSKVMSIRKFSFFTSILLILLSITTFTFSANAKQRITNHNSAVIMKISTIKSSPDTEGTDLFILNPGVKVDIKSNINGWYEVRLPNGKIGWIQNNNVERI